MSGLTLFDAGVDDPFVDIHGKSPRAIAELIARFKKRDAFVGF
ncbi:MAG: hypothetical protein AAGB93_19410 [Planctomycetota bacterium]